MCSHRASQFEGRANGDHPWHPMVSLCPFATMGGNKMLRKTSLVLAVVAALMLPSATFGKGGGHYGGYHGRYYWHSVWGHCWPGGWWRYGNWPDYGCWQWIPGSICWICG